MIVWKIILFLFCVIFSLFNGSFLPFHKEIKWLSNMCTWIVESLMKVSSNNYFTILKVDIFNFF